MIHTFPLVGEGVWQSLPTPRLPAPLLTRRGVMVVMVMVMVVWRYWWEMAMIDQTLLLGCHGVRIGFTDVCSSRRQSIFKIFGILKKQSV